MSSENLMKSVKKYQKLIFLIVGVFFIIVTLIKVYDGYGPSTPHVTLSYYPAKWETVVTVTQTVGCNDAKTRRVVLNTPSVATTYSSDFDKEPFRINIKDLEGALSDSDMTMTFTADGRLQSINQTSTGQGEMIVKSAVQLAVASSGVAVPPLAAKGVTVVPTPAPIGGTSEEFCKNVDKWGGGKPVTLSYIAKVGSEELGKDVALDAAPDSKELYSTLQNRLPKLKVHVNNVSIIKSGPSYSASSATASDDAILLELQKMGFVYITISANGDEIGAASIVIPTPGTYKVPIAKAKFSGKSAFAITLSENGAVTSVGYGKNAGAAGVMNALGTIVNTQTAAARATDLKAQADLIAEQNRLVLCQTKPDECPNK